LEKKYRLSKRDDYNKVYRYGSSSANKQLVIYFMSQPKIDHFRLGLSVSKKIGNAVTRNRVRRMIKEIARLHKLSIKNQMDYIFIARNPTATISYQELERSVIHLFRKNSLYSKLS
jgi:ribonuclease P protein component